MKDMFTQGGSGSAGIKTNKQAIARSYNVKVSEVIYSNDTTSTLDGKTIVYDKPAQFSWRIPTGIPSGATIVSVSGNTLTYNPGLVAVTLLNPEYSAKATENQLLRYGAMTDHPMVGTFEKGANVTTAIQSVGFVATGELYTWAGTLPKVVTAGSTPTNSGGISSSAWVLLDQTTKVSSNAINYKALYDDAILRLLPSKISELISVADFGAKGDGVTDDTNAFRAAIKAAYRSGDKGAGVYVPPKDTPYLIADVSINKAVRLYSDGKYGATLKTTSGSTLIVKARFTVIEGLNFEGGGKTAGNTTAIRIEEALVTVRDNSFAFYDACFMCEKGKSSAELLVHHNRFAASNFAVFMGGGQINSHFHHNTYSDCLTAIHSSEDLSIGVSGNTEGLVFSNETLYSCGDDSANRKAIEVFGTRWTWFDHCMSDLAKGTALYLENAKDAKVAMGYYSSNASASANCIEIKGSCDNLVMNGTCISDSRAFGMKIEDIGGVYPKSVRLSNLTFQNNDINATQQGDLLINSVPNVQATDCNFTCNKAGAITILSNEGPASLILNGTSHTGGVNLTTSTTTIKVINCVTHPELAEGLATIPNGATFVNVANTTKSLASRAVLVPEATAITNNAEAVTVNFNGDGTLRISRVGTSGNLPVSYRIKVVYS